MHFVVTGGAGFVGSHLVKLLLEEGHKITVIDNLHTGKKENLSEVIDKIQFLNLDIRDYDSMEKNMRNVDGVFHQAALTVVQDSLENPKEYHDVNVVGTENIFKIAAKNKFKVVFASSSSVYGNKQQTPISENAERIPINPYGKTKLEDELLGEWPRAEHNGWFTVEADETLMFGDDNDLKWKRAIDKYTHEYVNNLLVKI